MQRRKISAAWSAIPSTLGQGSPRFNLALTLHPPVSRMRIGTAAGESRDADMIVDLREPKAFPIRENQVDRETSVLSSWGLIAVSKIL